MKEIQRQQQEYHQLFELFNILNKSVKNSDFERPDDRKSELLDEVKVSYYKFLWSIESKMLEIEYTCPCGICSPPQNTVISKSYIERFVCNSQYESYVEPNWTPWELGEDWKISYEEIPNKIYDQEYINHWKKLNVEIHKPL